MIVFINYLKKIKPHFFLPTWKQVHLLNCDTHLSGSKYLLSLSSYSILHYILQPTGVTSNSKTLINNILPNTSLPSLDSGNLAASVSDLSQFFVSIKQL